MPFNITGMAPVVFGIRRWLHCLHFKIPGMDGMKDEAAIEAPDDPIRWYDRIAPLYDPIILSSYNRAREATAGQLRPEQGQTVLDVACGTGEFVTFWKG